MKKQRMQLLWLLLVLVLLTAGFYALQGYNKKQAEKQENEEKSIALDISTDEVLGFTYTDKDEEYTFEKIEGVWYYAADSSMKLDQERVNAMLEGVTPLLAGQKIENVTEQEQYGLDEPSKTIYFETASQNITLEVGDYNSMTKVYYVRILGEDTVYTVDSSVISGFAYSPEELLAEEETEESTEENTEEDTAEGEEEDTEEGTPKENE